MNTILQKISLRELHMAMVGLGAVVTAAVAVGILAPNVKTAKLITDKVTELESAAKDGDQLDRQLQEHRSNVDKLRYRLHGDMANLPARQIESYIIGRLQRVSWNNEVELVSVEPAMGERMQVFQEMLFNVSLVGEYDDLYRWLWEMRNDLGYIVVKEYNLGRFNSVDDNPLLTAKLSLASYRVVQ